MDQNNSEYGHFSCRAGDYWDVIVFTSKRWMYYAKDGNVKAASRYLYESRI